MWLFGFLNRKQQVNCSILYHIQLSGHLQQTSGTFLGRSEWKHVRWTQTGIWKTLCLIFTVKGAFWRQMSVFCGSFLL